MVDMRDILKAPIEAFDYWAGMHFDPETHVDHYGDCDPIKLHVTDFEQIHDIFAAFEKRADLNATTATIATYMATYIDFWLVEDLLIVFGENYLTAKALADVEEPTFENTWHLWMNLAGLAHLGGNIIDDHEHYQYIYDARENGFEWLIKDLGLDDLPEDDILDEYQGIIEEVIELCAEFCERFHDLHVAIESKE